MQEQKPYRKPDSNMSTFEQLKCDDDLKEVINSAFDADLDISGAWGYTQAQSTVIHSTEVPMVQLEHMLASMRTYIEMNMTRTKESRYGGIDINEIAREQKNIEGIRYDKVVYQITAMKEDLYTAFIKEYKEGYGTKDFDMTKHFEERKEATLTREEVYWFKLPETQS